MLHVKLRKGSIMAERITIQDIADALGISRNTVSKAINNTGVLADSTRDKILKKAAEMGYKQFSYISVSNMGKPELLLPNTKDTGEIALLTTYFLGGSHFASVMLDKFQRELSQLGYRLTMHRILEQEEKELQLPASFELQKTAGIICFEVFNEKYSQMLCNLDIPILFVDAPVPISGNTLKADRLCMDNDSNIFAFVKEMSRRGKNKIGFVGEYMHCQSFFERYMAYRNAMYLFGLPIDEQFCITRNKQDNTLLPPAEYQAYLTDYIQDLKSLPDVFICANDFVAIDLLHAFKALNISVPEDVYLCGFDDSPESRIITPPLTTIHIHSQVMGYSAVYLLLSRISEPSLNYRSVHTETTLIYRKSTGD